MKGEEPCERDRGRRWQESPKERQVAGSPGLFSRTEITARETTSLG